VETPQVYTYKDYGVVEVLGRDGNLTQIRVNGNDFWVKTSALKAKRDRTAQRRNLETWREKVAHDYVPYEPGKPYKLFDGAPGKPVADWIYAHLDYVTAQADPNHLERFAANLYHANGQIFDPMMPGFSITRQWGVSMVIRLTEDLPEEFVEAVEMLQDRSGCRAVESFTAERREVYCNELAWEVLRRGVLLGRVN
jgi:hypothetical protein